MKKNYWLKKNILIILVLILIIISVFPLISSSNAINQSNIKFLNEPLGNDWWPVFHHDTSHIGFSTSTAPVDNQVLWSYQTNDLITSSPVVSHGRVYVGSWDHNLYCFGMDYGNLLWNYSTGGMITATPAVANNNVYLGSQDTYLYCLDAINGDLIWSYKTNYMIESSPTIKDGKVYFGSNDGFLYCLDADSGNLVWKYSTQNAIWSSPVVTDNYLYFGDLNGIFYCINVNTGNPVWLYTISSGIWSSPAFDNGKVYFGGNDFNVYCLNANTGDLIWNYTSLGEVHSSPAIAYNYIYIGTSDGRLLCLDKETGAFVWSYQISGSVGSSPAIADGKVYFGTDPCCGNPCYLLCLDAYTETKIWDYNFQSIIGMKSSPAIAASKIFVGSGNGKVFAFGKIEFLADANGPYHGFIGYLVNFTGSVYGGDPGYSWHWDFGDGETSIDQNPTHIYDEIGQYKVTLTVTDNNGSVAIDETQAYIEIPNNPPDTPIIDGQTNGKIGEEYTYCIIGVDPDQDYLYVRWDWGDGNTTNWLGPYASGNKICASYIWEKKGIYLISVSLKDQHDDVVTSSLEVTMPRSKSIKTIVLRILGNYTLLFKILQILF